jgi:hypothetical protein
MDYFAFEWFGDLGFLIFYTSEFFTFVYMAKDMERGTIQNIDNLIFIYDFLLHVARRQMHFLFIEVRGRKSACFL